MKITKFVHSCLLVEAGGSINKTALFDPGTMSEDALDIESLKYLDDIFITHEHADHISKKLLKKLVSKFPDVRITTTHAVAQQLKEEGIKSQTVPSEGTTFFSAPHEGHSPFLKPPEEIGVHYLETFTNPGDSHSFAESKQILALPITAPWGSADRAVQLALELKPRYIIPVHDWHWKDEVREQMYDRLEDLFNNEGITFFKMKTGEPVVIETDTYVL